MKFFFSYFHTLFIKITIKTWVYCNNPVWKVLHILFMFMFCLFGPEHHWGKDPIRSGNTFGFFSSRRDHFWGFPHEWKHWHISACDSSSGTEAWQGSIAPPNVIDSCYQHITSHTHTTFGTRVGLPKTNTLIIYIALAPPYRKWDILDFVHFDTFEILLQGGSSDSRQIWSTWREDVPDVKLWRELQ